jgi:hypothetical protein
MDQALVLSRPWWRRRTWVVPAVLATASLGIAVPVAAGVVAGDDGSQAAFHHLHPNKADARSTTEQNHVLIGTFDADAQIVRAYVTLPSGPNACALVEHVTAAGNEIDSISYCGSEPEDGADVRTINGVLLGWVPDARITSITMTAGDVALGTHVEVVAHRFVLPAPQPVGAGSVGSVIGFGSGEQVLGRWNVTF